MVIARCLINKVERYAEIKDDKLYLIEGDCFDIKKIFATPYEGEYKLLPPVNPSKILALGANYHKHAEELNLKVNSDPTIFMKPITALIASGDNIILPDSATHVDYEAELVIVIAKYCKNVRRDRAEEYILGYTCANDVSERVFQKLDGQWTRAKGFDTFCPLGPYLVTDIDASDLDIKAVRNGEVVQHSRTSNMIHKIPDIIEFITSVMTLKAGDIILTGTPERVGQIKAGDTIEIVIENVGCLRNNVIRERL